MFKIDTRDLKRLERDLKTFASKAVPFAVRNSLNGAAFEGRKLWQKELQDDLILRNRFTAGSIRVEQARTLNVRTMEATLGSEAPYMRRLEFGGMVSGARPTEVAAGQAMGSRPRTRLVRPSNKVIRLTDRHKTGGRKLRNRIAIQRALEAGNKFVCLETAKGPGIFQITGRRRRLQVRQIWDLSRQPRHVPAHPTLEPTLAKLERRMDRICREAFLAQLRRHKVFGY